MRMRKSTATVMMIMMATGINATNAMMMTGMASMVLMMKMSTATMTMNLAQRILLSRPLAITRPAVATPASATTRTHATIPRMPSFTKPMNAPIVSPVFGVLQG